MRVSIHIYLRESPKDSHHFIFGLNYIRTDERTHTLAPNTQYAFCYTYFIVCAILWPGSSVGVFRLLFNVVSVALPSIVGNMYTLAARNFPPFLRDASEVFRGAERAAQFFSVSIHFVIGVCTSYDLYVAIYFRLNPFRSAPMIELKYDDGTQLAVAVT